MPQPCSVCSHEHHQQIESALAAGETLRGIARTFRVSEDALSRHKSHRSAATAARVSTPAADTPAPTLPAALSPLEQRCQALLDALRALESCDAESIEQHYQATLLPLRALVAGMVDESLSRIHERESQRVTSAWDREGLRAKFGGWLQATWRQSLAEAISR